MKQACARAVVEYVGCPCYGVTVRARGTPGVEDGSVGWSFIHVFKKPSGCLLSYTGTGWDRDPRTLCLLRCVFWCVCVIWIQ